MRLTNIERETIVNYNQAEDIAYVYTCNPLWWRHFADFGVEPVRVHGEGRGVYAKDYEIPKNWVKPPRPPRRVSERQREAARRTMRNIHRGRGQGIDSELVNIGIMP